MNHCIREFGLLYFRPNFLIHMLRPLPAVLDLIEVDEENLGFIVMEQVGLRMTVFRDSPVNKIAVEFTINRRRSTMLLAPVYRCPSSVC